MRHITPTGWRGNHKREPTAILTALVRSYVALLFLLLVLVGVGLLWWSSIPTAGQYAELAKLLGTVLVPSALVSFLFEFFLRRSLLAEMKMQLADSFREEVALLRELEVAGFERVFPTFPLEYVATSFDNARGRICILANWFPNAIQLEQSLATAARNGCKVRVVLLNPTSSYAKGRAHDLRYSDPDSVAGEIQASLEELGRFFGRHGILDKIEVCLHDFTPTHILFAWDDRVLFGTYLIGVHALQGPFFEFSVRDSGVGRLLLENFEKLWDTQRLYHLAGGGSVPTPKS